MFYAILGQDAPNSMEKRLSARPAHMARVTVLQEQGRLLTAGPLCAQDIPDPLAAGFVGSLIIAEFDSLEEAQDWARQDPYSVEGVFSDILVRPFVKLFPQ